MARLQWNKPGENKFETGVDRGVLFTFDSDTTDYNNGVAWNGLTNVTKSPTGAEPNAFYADNKKYLNLMSAEEFGFSIECYTYPDEWELCDGSKMFSGLSVGQQPRTSFGFAWRTRVGNEIVGDSLGYKIHLAWNALASPSEQSYATVNETPEPGTFSYECTTTAVDFPDDFDVQMRPTSYMSVDSTDKDTDPAALKALEDIIWGSEQDEPRMPTIEEVVRLFKGGDTSGEA